VSFVRFTPLDHLPVGVGDVVRLLREDFGPDNVAFGGFAYETAPDALIWWMKGDPARGRQDFSPFLTADALATLDPDLPAPTAFRMFQGFKPVKISTLPDDIAEVLAAGPTRLRPRLLPDWAGRAARDFCAALLGGRSKRIFAFFSAARWTYWFPGQVGGFTWLIIDTATRHVWLLCVTDDL
jgi:hypothetical protein